MTRGIRRFRAEDAARCAAIVDATPLWRRYDLSGQRAAELLVAAAERLDPVFVLDEEGLAQGFAWMVERGAFARAPYLRLIAVSPEGRSQGRGAALLEAFDVHARGLSRDAFLLVSDFNEGGRRFYARHGWVEVGRVPDMVVPGVAELILRKALR